MSSVPFCLPASAAHHGHGCPAILARRGDMQNFWGGYDLGSEHGFCKPADQGSATGDLPHRNLSHLIDPGDQSF